MKKIIFKFIEKFGYTIARKKADPVTTCPDIKEAGFWETYNFCKPYSMAGAERMYALYNSVNYVLSANITGDFVECGVWRGGSAMMIAKILVDRNITDRNIYLYDTFEGMTAPTAADINIVGQDATAMLEQNELNKDSTIWCYADLEDVQRNMKSTGFSPQNMIYVKGKVEDTIPGTMPAKNIALLRLDTDWYESTKHELIHLFPKLQSKAVLIIDDYGHWEGCKKAVDEYLDENKIQILLDRVDYTCRVGVKM
ncbi:MAG: TylF/MycF/NovP-related O-methyltransferase [Ferruginibacter sp.]